MLVDTSSAIYAALGSRDWWGGWSDAASIAVFVGVALESVADFEILAKITGLAARPTLKKRVEKLGLVILIVSLLAEVGINRHISDATATIETNLTTGVKGAVSANSDLAGKILNEQGDIATAQGSLKGLTTQVGKQSDLIDKSKSRIDTLSSGESNLQSALNQDDTKMGRLIASQQSLEIVSAQLAALDAQMIREQGPRIIDNGRFEAAFSAIPKVPIFLVSTSESESHDFSEKLQTALERAGFKVTRLHDTRKHIFEGLSAVTAVKTFGDVGRFRDRDVDSAASAIVSALKNESGIDATAVQRIVGSVWWEHCVPTDALLLRVERVPQRLALDQWIAALTAKNPGANVLTIQPYDRSMENDACGK